MTKTILILAIATAFVVGSVMTGTMAYATGDKNGKPFEALWDAIHALETAFSLDDDADSSNEDQSLSGTGEVVLSTTAAGDGGGTVTCASITGDASLCDGDDAVVDNDNDSSNELQILSGAGSVDLSNGGSSVSCASITGGAGLCDGVDNTGATQSLVVTQRSSAIKTISAGNVGTETINCLAGEKVTGGGVRHSTGLFVNGHIVNSFPTSTGWKGTMHNVNTGTAEIKFTVYVLCAKLT